MILSSSEYGKSLGNLIKEIAAFIDFVTKRVSSNNLTAAHS